MYFSSCGLILTFHLPDQFQTYRSALLLCWWCWGCLGWVCCPSWCLHFDLPGLAKIALYWVLSNLITMKMLHADEFWVRYTLYLTSALVLSYLWAFKLTWIPKWNIIEFGCKKCRCGAWFELSSYQSVTKWKKIAPKEAYYQYQGNRVLAIVI